MGVSQQRITAIETRLAELEARPVDPREARLPVTVAHRCRRARKAMRSLGVALKRGDLERASRLAADAEREIELADEIVEGMLKVE